MYGRWQQEKNAKTSLDMLRGGMLVFSCCVMNYKCSCLKEHTVVWVESLSAPHSFRHLAQVWPGHTTEAYTSNGYTEAPSGCWQNSSSGCRTEVPVFLLAVPVGNS